MESLTSRPVAGAGDVARVLDLLRTCRAVKPIDLWPPLHEVRHHLRDCKASRAADARLWEDQLGELMAFATLWDETMLVSCVHPAAQCDDLAQHVLEWGTARASGRARRCGERAVLFVPICVDDFAAALQLERYGFVPEDWCILRMARRLNIAVPPPDPPAGFTLRMMTSEQELAAAVALQQELGIVGPTLLRERQALRHAADVAVIDLAATAPDGELAAICLCSTSDLDAAPHTPCSGWVELLGTRPAYRRRGLGRALLLAGLQHLGAHGATVALLGTTSWNIDAQRLFASVGFRLAHRIRWYTWTAAERSASYGA